MVVLQKLKQTKNYINEIFHFLSKNFTGLKSVPLAKDNLVVTFFKLGHCYKWKDAILMCIRNIGIN